MASKSFVLEKFCANCAKWRVPAAVPSPARRRAASPPRQQMPERPIRNERIPSDAGHEYRQQSRSEILGRRRAVPALLLRSRGRGRSTRRLADADHRPRRPPVAHRRIPPRLPGPPAGRGHLLRSPDDGPGNQRRSLARGALLLRPDGLHLRAAGGSARGPPRAGPGGGGDGRERSRGLCADCRGRRGAGDWGVPASGGGAAGEPDPAEDRRRRRTLGGAEGGGAGAHQVSGQGHPEAVGGGLSDRRRDGDVARRGLRRPDRRHGPDPRQCGPVLQFPAADYRSAHNVSGSGGGDGGRARAGASLLDAGRAGRRPAALQARRRFPPSGACSRHGDAALAGQHAVPAGGPAGGVRANRPDHASRSG